MRHVRTISTQLLPSKVLGIKKHMIICISQLRGKESVSQLCSHRVKKRGKQNGLCYFFQCIVFFLSKSVKVFCLFKPPVASFQA